MKFEYNDGGRSKSERPRQRKDCVVRALAITFKAEYDLMYDELAIAGRDCGQGVRRTSYTPLLDTNAERLKELPSWQLGDFQLSHEIGRFIVIIERHALALVDGVWQDMVQPRPETPIHHAWQVHKAWSKPRQDARLVKKLMKAKYI